MAHVTETPGFRVRRVGATLTAVAGECPDSIIATLSSAPVAARGLANTRRLPVGTELGHQLGSRLAGALVLRRPQP